MACNRNKLQMLSECERYESTNSVTKRTVLCLLQYSSSTCETHINVVTFCDFVFFT